MYLDYHFLRLVYAVKFACVVYTVCVCTMCRYLDYGEEVWKNKARDSLSGLRTYVKVKFWWSLF